MAAGALLLAASGVPAATQSVLPSGGQVVAGSAAIGAPAGNSLTINQSSSRAVVNWNTFSVGQPNTVTFSQPGSSAAILNRVTGAMSSTIAGQINGNGQVYLVNPNGIAITPSGSVQVGGGFVASTLGITDSNFMGGNLAFTGTGASAGVSNAGHIGVGANGFAALLGGTASNSGTIAVPLGKVALGSGEAATLDVNGGGFLQVAVPTGAQTARGEALVSNSGRVEAAGGTVEMKAATVAGAIRNAVNMSGVVAANSISGRDGAITLDGGPGGAVAVTGTLSAAARETSTAKGGTVTVDGSGVRLGHRALVDASGATGGTVRVGVSGPGGANKAQQTTIASGARVLARGNPKVPGSGGQIETSGETLKLGRATIDAGQGGKWLVDPVDLTIDTNAATTISAALNAGTDVTEQTTATSASGLGTTAAGNGDIDVAAPITWTGAATLTLSAYNNINIDSAISYDTGTLALTSNNANVNPNAGINVAAPITVSGAGILSLDTVGSSFGPVFTMGQGSAQFTGGAGVGASLAINGQPYILVYDMAGIGAMSGSPGNFALAVPIDAGFSGTFAAAPVTGVFSGNFNGLGNAISNLTLNVSTQNAAALFEDLNGTVFNFGLGNASITGSGSVSVAAGLAAVNTGVIANSYVTGTIDAPGALFVGGLVGESAGTISTSYATAAVEAAAGSAASSGSTAAEP